MITKMQILADLAKQAIEDGYPAGHKWEGLLRTHLQEHNPKLVKDLGKSLQDYLTVTVSTAIDLTVELTNQGMPPMEAEFEARREMFPPGEEDIEDDRQMIQSTLPPEIGDTKIPNLSAAE